jgi:predicted MFS family arabinose efflux permease
VPLGTLAADSVGWRGSFWILAAISFFIGVLMHVVMPQLPVSASAHPDQKQTAILRQPRFLAHLLLSILTFTSLFTAYTYLADILERLGGIPAGQVGWWLMGFGAIGLIGNWLGGRVVDRSPLRATAVFLLLLALGMALCVPVAKTGVLLYLTLAVWGIAYTALFPVSQVRVMNSVTHSQALAGTTNVSAANAGIGIGAIIGGLVIPAWGLGSIGYVAAAVALLGVVLIPLVHRARG